MKVERLCCVLWLCLTDLFHFHHTGGLSPFLATLLVDEVGTSAPGIRLVLLSVASLFGLWIVAPRNHDHIKLSQVQQEEDWFDESRSATNGVNVEMNVIT